MSEHTWADGADRVLARLFKRGEPAPTAKELKDAYPFGERAMWPYKVWLRRVKAWRTAHALGLSGPLTPHAPRRVDPRAADTETIDAFGGAA